MLGHLIRNFEEGKKCGVGAIGYENNACAKILESQKQNQKKNTLAGRLMIHLVRTSLSFFIVLYTRLVTTLGLGNYGSVLNFSRKASFLKKKKNPDWMDRLSLSIPLWLRSGGVVGSE